jgi:type VI secretion system secreted protein Hcp
MRISHAGRLFVLCGAISALLPAVQVMAAVDAFMTVTGTKQGAIKGEARGGSIHLVSVTRDAASGMPTGRRTHSTVTITKEVDQASPMFFKASTSHEILSEVAITFEGGSRGAKAVEKIVMKNATIVSIRKAGGGNESMRKAGGSNEEITFEYQSIEVTWTDGGKTATDDWEAPK